MHYYKHHIGDYRRDTAHLSLLEHGVYRQLLDWYYLEESPIPKETQTVFRRLSARTQDEQKAVENVLNDFFTLTESGWVNGRCCVELADYHGHAEVNRANGKLGGRPKKTHSVISGNPDHNPSESENNLNHKPLTINQEPIKSKAFVAPKARPSKKPPDDFSITPEMREWARTKTPNVNIDLETEAFLDHTFAHGKTDWVGTWRNWMRRSGRDKSRPPDKSPKLGLADQVMQTHHQNQHRRLACLS